VANRQGDGLAPGRRTGEIATEQRGHGSDVLPPGRPKTKQPPRGEATRAAAECGGIMLDR
jgi:hypothetical protein